MNMPRAMVWLPMVIRVAIAPVLVGALVFVGESPRSGGDLAAAGGLVLVGVIHISYWWQPWPTSQQRAIAALAGMVVTNFVLFNLLGINEALLWLYPALIAGAGLRAPAAVVGIGLTALAAAAPIALEGRIVHPAAGVDPTVALGPSHSVLISIVLAGLGMAAVRQLIAVNADLQATRADLADLAVARDRERLARELHDLLGRTLSLIAVKAELASRLSAAGDPWARTELADVQRLARQAVRDVRETIAGAYAPRVETELAAAEIALRSVGINVCVDNAAESLDPAHETTIAWAVREAVTNVVKHSGAQTCRISLEASDVYTTLNVEDDGHGGVGVGAGTGLSGLADRVHAVGGRLELGPGDAGGLRLRVQLGGTVPPPRAEIGP